MILFGPFDIVKHTHLLRGGGILIVTGRRLASGGILVLGVTFHPRLEQQAA